MYVGQPTSQPASRLSRQAFMRSDRQAVRRIAARTYICTQPGKSKTEAHDIRQSGGRIFNHKLHTNQSIAPQAHCVLAGER